MIERLSNVGKARSLLGFRAKTALEEGPKKTIEWCRETQSRMKKSRA